MLYGQTCLKINCLSLSLSLSLPFTLIITLAGLGNYQGVGLSAQVVSRWLRPGNRTFLQVAGIVVPWWIVDLLSSIDIIFS